MSYGKLCDYCKKQYAVFAKDWPGATFSDRVEPPKPTEYLCATHGTLFPKGALRELTPEEKKDLA